MKNKNKFSMKFIFNLCLLSILWHAPANATMKFENRFDFQIREDLPASTVQMAIAPNLSLNEVNSSYFSLMPIQNAPANAQGRYLIFRSAVLVKQPIALFQQIQTPTVQMMQRFFPHIKVDQTVQNLNNGAVLRLSTELPGAAALAAKLVGAEDRVTFTSTISRFGADRTKWQPDLIAYVNGIGSNPPPDAILQLAANNFNMVFAGSRVITRIYARGNQSLVVTDAIYLVKQETIDKINGIPGLLRPNLWKNLTEQMAEESEKYVQAVNSYGN